MVKPSNEQLDAIRRDVDRDFPADPALQQVHMARRILALEAELNHVTYLEHVHAVAEEQLRTVSAERA